MERMSKTAAQYLHQIIGLTDRLAAKDIVVVQLMVHGAGYEWELLVEKGEEAEEYARTLREGHTPYEKLRGPDVLRFFWDGRDHILTVQSSPVRGVSAPNEWKFECGKPFGDTSDDLFAFVEDYLTRRFS